MLTVIEAGAILGWDVGSMTVGNGSDQEALKVHRCTQVFGSARKLSTHMWAKHKVKSSIRSLVADESVCPHCSVDFRTRDRVIKHLN